MKNNWFKIIFFTLSVLFVIVPLGVYAATQNQINASVHLVCPDNSGNIFSGSGTMISDKGIILTNKHVVTSIDDSIIQFCLVGFGENINAYANFDNIYVAETKYVSDSEYLDSAILYIVDADKKFSYYNIFNSTSGLLTTSNRIEALGYPSYNDLKLTDTTGTFKNKGVGYLKEYFEASTYINHGNSGGSTYSVNAFVGMPTLGITTTEGMRYYFLSIDSIKNWLREKLGNDYATQILGYNPSTEKPNIILPNDYNPPHYNQLEIGLYQYGDDNILNNYSSIRDGVAIYENQKISFGWDQDCFGETEQIQKDVCIMDDESSIKGYYYYFGSNPNANPVVDGVYISANEMSRDTYWKSLGYNNIPYGVRLPIVFNAQGGKNYFILQAQDVNGNISNSLVNIEYIREVESFKDIKSFDVKDYKNKSIGNIRYPNRYEIPGCLTNSYCPENHKLDYTNKTIYTNQSTLYLYPNYEYDIDGMVYYVSYGDDRWWFDKTRKGTITSDKYIKISNLDKNKITNIFLKPRQGGINEFFGKHIVLTIEYKNNLLNQIAVDTQVVDGYINSGKFIITYKEKKLMALANVKGAAVYYIAPNGKKYVFPDSKTYFTWFKNFDDVEKVSASELDTYPNGGMMPYKQGVKLITHQDTAKVYAVESNGVIRPIPSEAVAINLYGPNWASIVQDVIPGVFSTSYTLGSELNNVLPNGSIVKNNSNFYYIYNETKRMFASINILEQNGFDQNNAINATDLSNYSDGQNINAYESSIAEFNL